MTQKQRLKLTYVLLVTAFCNMQTVFGQTDSLANDSSVVQNEIVDSTISTKDELENKVIFSSYDSIHIDVKKNEIHLFNNAVVKYGEITLEAAHITIEGKTNTIRAIYLADSSGNPYGKPVYTEGDDRYEASQMAYNFKTKKAWIKDAVTKAEGGYLVGDEVKIAEKDVIWTHRNIFTTCSNTDHPHFGLRITKGKYIPDDKIVAGPSYLEIAQIPLPIGLPFAYYPLNEGKRHGLIFPQFGESELGFFLRGLGYYFPLGDKAALEVRADIYSLGSYRLNNTFSYKKRYKFSGNLSANYASIRQGDPETPGFKPNQELFFSWTHNQDPKARPNSRFSARVNAGSNKFWQDNSFATNKFAQNSFNSSVSYNKTFAGTPFTMSAALRHSQNTQTRILDITAPEVSVNMRRINPLKRKVAVGAAKWYENIGVSYSLNTKARIADVDSTYLDNLFDKAQLGALHIIPISTSIKVLKYLQLSPSLNINERWYYRSVNKTFNLDSNRIETDTTNGFFRANDFTTGFSLNTRIFGTYYTKQKGWLHGIKHTINPSVSFSYRPDYSEGRYGYYKEVQSDTSGKNFLRYSSFEGNNAVAGLSPTGRQGSINFGIDNNLELKARNRKDSTGKSKKIKVIDSYRISGGYNLALDSFQLSNINMSARTSFKNFSLRFNSNLDPYKRLDNGNRVNEFLISERTLATLTSANITLTGQLKNANSSRTNSAGTQEELDFINEYPEYYVDFNVPFNLSFNYTYSFGRATVKDQENNIRQNLTLGADVNLTPKWKMVINSGYDITNMEITPTQISIYRDLHCWDLNFNIVPFGTRRSYLFTIKPKASVLQALKLTQRRDWYDLR